jgi:hypothetical protein
LFTHTHTQTDFYNSVMQFMCTVGDSLGSSWCWDYEVRCSNGEATQPAAPTMGLHSPPLQRWGNTARRSNDGATQPAVPTMGQHSPPLQRWGNTARCSFKTLLLYSLSSWDGAGPLADTDEAGHTGLNAGLLTSPRRHFRCLRSQFEEIRWHFDALQRPSNSLF